ncbi:phosphoglycolate phosphatase [Corynebacterium humireducens NBRC 106098 = DSM 45392]|uniref:Phosphoglycolate phosphatase n=1 Tax=Corynebacterium humireducens NBRC 106098 = DSM 45392 TaxID=1223515 RepID=A0A0B5DDH2_9CORY|nr:HAD family hydrolase [Corynebacterium humireducens]AJE34288.1 phosphoglycolate phosphatase [Corynebacterium humireducens NBRC 106098 = DSM 45392]
MLLPADTRAVLYDLDGTLVDHEHAARAGVESWSRALGLPAGQWQRWLTIERKWFTAFENGEVSHLGQRVARCREFIGRAELSDEEALTMYEDYLAVYRSNWVAYPDALPSLRAALERGLTVGVLTNGAEEMQRAKLERTGLWLDGMIMCATVELGAPKPQPESYRAALEKVGASAGHTVMIGDSWENDVAGARRAGLHAVYLDRTGNEGTSISSLDELVWP